MSIKAEYTVQPNSISCYIGRICKIDNNFASNGKLYVDFYDLDGSKNGPEYGEDGSTQQLVIASWTLRAAYAAWTKPPKIKYKGKLVGKGSVKLPQAQLSQVSINGGPPMQGTTTCTTGPGTSTTPVVISNATGTAKIEDSANAEINVETDKLEIELVPDKSSLLPWCTDVAGEEGDDIANRKSFIIVGDKALCMAMANSLDNVYCVDIFK